MRGTPYTGPVASATEFFVATPNAMNLPARRLGGSFADEARAREALAWLQLREPGARLFRRVAFLELLEES